MKKMLNQNKFQTKKIETLNLNNKLMRMKARLYSQKLKKLSLLWMWYMQNQFKMLNKRLRSKIKVLLQYYQRKMKNIY